MDRTYKDGDCVQIDFYSHEEPLCSVEGQVSGEYLNVTGGSIPLDINQVFTTNIVSMPDLKENANPDPSALDNQASVDTFINEFKERLKRYGHSHGNNQTLEDVFQILNATKQSYEKGDLSPKLQHNPCNDMADIMADPELYKHWMETSGRYL